MNYFLHLVIYLCMYGIVALSLNVIVGYCGLLTIAHAGFFAVGSYAYALASLQLGLDFLPATILGVVSAAVISLALSVPAWKFKGDSIVLVSLALQAVLYALIYNWVTPGEAPGTLKNLTNGPFGLAGIPKPSFVGLQLTSIEEVASLAVILLALCSLIAWRLLTSPWGRLLKCMRDDELALRGLGKRVRLIKIQAIAISCGMVAIAGALYASYIGYIDPSLASLNESILVLCMVIVGGAGNFRGPLIGALVLVAIPEMLSVLSISDTSVANIRLMIYGLLLITMMHFRPQGLAGEYRVE